MTELLWQAWLLLAAAFFLGAVLSCSLKRRFYYPRSSKASGVIVSGVPNAPAPTEPKIEVAPRGPVEGERFNRAISGQPAVAAAAAAAASAPAAAAPAAPAKAPMPAPAPTPAATAPATPAPAAAPVAAAKQQAPATGDDLTRIRVIDAKIRKLLNEAGITRFAELAALSPAGVSELSDKIGLRGRAEQENWVGQARILASGGETYYSRRTERGEPVPQFTPSAKPAATAVSNPDPASAPSRLPLAITPAAGLLDDLTRVRGIDIATQGKLREFGIGSFAALASLTAADVKALNEALGAKGRIEQENWLGQSHILATGGETYYSRRRAEAAPAEKAQAPEPAPTPASAPAPAPAAAAPEAPPAAPAPAPEPSPAAASAPPAPAPAVAELSADAAPVAVATAVDVAPLRSVRSEALLGADVTRSTRSAHETDDLKRIRGIGVLIEKKLNSLGIVHYEQVANWTGADIERISRILDFKGRIERENWIEQARILATGGQTEFSRRTE